MGPVTHISYHTHWHITDDRVAKQIRALRTEMRTAMATTQEQLDTIVSAIATGVQELRDEITRLAAANPAVDFTAAQALADALASDNIPAVEPPTDVV